MSNKGALVINALCKNKDIGALYTSGVDEILSTGAYGDAIEFIKNYHSSYHGIPDFEILKKHFNDIPEIETSAPTEYYIDDLRNDYVKNRVDEIMAKANNALKDNSPLFVLNNLQSSLGKLNRFAGGAVDANIMDFDDADRHYEEVRERIKAMGGSAGILTGIDFIDASYPTGMMPGDLIVVLGWTGRAKSFFTTLVACNAHDCGYKPMIVSLEMSKEKVRDRVLTIKGKGKVQNSLLSIGETGNQFNQIRMEQDGKPEFIVLNNEGAAELTPNIVESKIDQHQPKLVILDYAQLASDNAMSESMTHRMMNMSKEYKRLAMKKQVTIVIISSATADNGSVADEPPTIGQVAWSKQLAYDADLAYAVHKHDGGNLVTIQCSKNRNGSLFSGMLDWDIDNGIIKEVQM